MKEPLSFISFKKAFNVDLPDFKKPVNFPCIFSMLGDCFFS